MRVFIFCLAAVVLATNVFAADSKLDKLIQGLESPSEQARMAAASGLVELGPLARPALPALVKALKRDDLAFQHEVIMALGQIGPDAAPAVSTLTEVAANGSTIVRHAAIHALRMIGSASAPAAPVLRRAMTDKSPFIQVASAWAVASITPEDKASLAQVIPLLMQSLNNPQVSSDAVFALAEIGKPAVPALSAAIGQHSPAVCMHVCDALSGMGLEAVDAVEKLVATLDDTDEQVCWHAARALGSIGAKPDLVVPALVKQLESPDRAVRISAAHSLGAFADEAAPGVTSLIAALSMSDDEALRGTAARTLGLIGPKAYKAVPALNRALDDKSAAVAINSIDALGQIGEASVPALVGRLADPDFRRFATAVLSDMGPAAAAAVPALTKQLEIDDLETRLESCIALSRIGPAAKSAIPALMSVLKGDGKGRGAAAFALGKLGAKEAISLLKTTSTADDEKLRLASGWALAVLAPENTEYVKNAVPALITALAAEEPLVRREAAAALSLIGPPGKSATDALIENLVHPEPRVRSTALEALIEVNVEHESLLGIALRLIEDPDPQTRRTAAYALGRLGERGKPGIPALQKLSRSSDRMDRTAAGWSMVKIDPSPKNVDIALPLFIQAIGHENPKVRIELAKIMGQIGVGDPRTRDALKKLAEDQDPDVQAAAQAALKGQ